MAKQRYVNTKFWSDNWVREINPLDRYLFLYFLTNEHTNICGIYELPLATMSFETGISERDLKNSFLPRLQPKIFYVEGWVYIVNFQKHQSTTSLTIKKGIEVEMEKVPKDIKERIGYLYPMDTPSSPSIYLNSNSNSNLNSNSNAQVRSEDSEPIKKEEVKKIPFEQFWENYPYKVRKKKSKEKWDNLKYEIQEIILKDLPERIKGEKWFKEGGRFIEMPTTYLNEERWNDEIWKQGDLTSVIDFTK